MSLDTFQLRKSFALFDKDGDGTIQLEELRNVLQALGQYMTESQMEKLIAEVDANNDGTINFE
jgi:calmodulin